MGLMKLQSLRGVVAWVLVARAAGAPQLSALLSSSGTLSPSFNSTVLRYDVVVANNVASVGLTATFGGTVAIATIDGTDLADGVESTPRTLTDGTTNVVIQLTDVDSSSAQYTVKVHRGAVLTALSISSGSLAPVFATNTTEYSVVVNNTINTVSLTPSFSPAVATLALGGNNVASGATSAQQTLTDSTTVLSMLLTHVDTTTTNTYTVTVYRVSALSALTPSAGTLNPTFSTSVLSYNLSVLYAVSSLTLTPTANPAVGATVTVVNTTVVSGQASQLINVSSGVTINVKVKVANTAGTTEYTVAITRQSPSSTAGLADLIPSSGFLSPAVYFETLSYSISVGNGISQLLFTPTLIDSTATITVGGTSVAEGQQSAGQALTEGGTVTITVVVTAEDRVTTATYTITASRAPSTVTTLSNVVSSSGVMTPAPPFNPNVLSYSVAVVNSVASVTLTPTSTHPLATMKVEGVTVASGTESPAINLTEGATKTATIAITAQDGTTTGQYSFAISREPSAVSSLSSLVLTKTDGTALSGSLSPIFSSTTFAYTMSVTFAESPVRVTPTVTHLATVQVSRDATSQAVAINPTAVTSGTASQPLSLTEGVTNRVQATVTAQNGYSNSTYVVDIVRGPSSDAQLNELNPSHGTLTVNGAILIPSPFRASQMSYDVTVDNNILAITFTSLTNHFGASVAVGPEASNLAEGSNTIMNITVTAQDNVTKTIYTIKVYRRPSINANLLFLIPMYGKLVPDFQTSITQYTIAVPYEVATIQFRSYPEHWAAVTTTGGAAVAVNETSIPAALTAGATIDVPTQVTSQSGLSKLYSVFVTRSAPLNETCSFLRFGRNGLSSTPLGLYNAQFTPSPYYNSKQWYKEVGGVHFMYWDMSYFSSVGGRWVVARSGAVGGNLPEDKGQPTIIYTNAAITMTPYEINQDASSWIGHSPNGIADPNQAVARVFCSSEALVGQEL